MLSAAWPGNIRQLHNVVEQSVALSTTPLIPASLVQRALHNEYAEIPPFNEARNQFERDYLTRLMQITNGNVTQAARLSRIERQSFQQVMRKYNIRSESFRGGAKK